MKIGDEIACIYISGAEKLSECSPWSGERFWGLGESWATASKTQTRLSDSSNRGMEWLALKATVSYSQVARLLSELSYAQEMTFPNESVFLDLFFITGMRFSWAPLHCHTTLLTNSVNTI